MILPHLAGGWVSPFSQPPSHIIVKEKQKKIIGVDKGK